MYADVRPKIYWGRWLFRLVFGIKRHPDNRNYQGVVGHRVRGRALFLREFARPAPACDSAAC